MASLVHVFQDTLERIAGISQDPSVRFTASSAAVATFVPPKDVYMTTIEIKNTDCVDEVTWLRQQAGDKVRIGLLNMANEEFVGGGVAHGARAQEEGEISCQGDLHACRGRY